jgi:branched-chain amino acid transport system permease protein
MKSSTASAFRKNLVYGLLAAVVLMVCPFILPIYWTFILTEIVIMGFFAMSFNLLLGFTGLLSFGQAGFFGVGAYSVGLVLTHGGESLFIAMTVGVLLAALVALLIGYLCVRRDEIYFAMITLGFGMMLYTIAHNWIELTGGSDGLPLLSVPPLRLFGMELSLFDPVNMYYLVLVVCALGSWVLWRVVRSPFGLMLTAMRENKERLSFAGADVQRVRLAAFVVAGGLAGLAGGLFALFSTMATPDFLHWGFSAKPVLMTILGGSGIFFGPAFGAAIFFALEQLTTHYTENWMIILGAIIIPVVIFFPRGILGTLVHAFRNRKEKRP